MKNYSTFSNLLLIYFLIFINFIFFEKINAQEINEMGLSVKAEKALEWHQLENKIIAIGNAKIQTKEVTLKAEKIIILYNGKIEDGKLKNLNATGDAFIKNGTNQIFANSITYNLISQVINVSGNNIRMTTKNGNIKSSDKLKFLIKKSLVNIEGKGEIELKNNGTIFANKIDIYLTPEGSVLKLIAQDKVKIAFANQTQIISADKANLDNEKSIINLEGNVILTQGSNKLMGDAATVDIAKGISRMISKNSNSIKGILSN